MNGSLRELVFDELVPYGDWASPGNGLPSATGVSIERVAYGYVLSFQRVSTLNGLPPVTSFHPELVRIGLLSLLASFQLAPALNWLWWTTSSSR